MPISHFLIKKRKRKENGISSRHCYNKCHCLALEEGFPDPQPGLPLVLLSRNLITNA